LRELKDIQAGDVIPIEMPSKVSLTTSDGIPLFDGQLGVCNGNFSVKIDSKVSLNNS